MSEEIELLKKILDTLTLMAIEGEDNDIKCICLDLKSLIIKKSKKYRLRKGNEVIVFNIFENDESFYKFHGVYKSEGKWYSIAWTNKMRYWPDSLQESEYDLIEIE